MHALRLRRSPKDLEAVARAPGLRVQDEIDLVEVRQKITLRNVLQGRPGTGGATRVLGVRLWKRGDEKGALIFVHRVEVPRTNGLNYKLESLAS